MLLLSSTTKPLYNNNNKSEFLFSAHFALSGSIAYRESTELLQRLKRGVFAKERTQATGGSRTGREGMEPRTTCLQSIRNAKHSPTKRKPTTQQSVALKSPRHLLPHVWD